MHEEPATGSVTPGAPSGTVHLFAPGTSLGTRYEIREVLGTGGFAVVYRARDRTLRREVALKVLRPDRLSDESLRRFRREVAVARDVPSPRLVRIFDIEDATETIYFAMELVKGRSLRERLARGPLAVAETLRIATQLLEGLGALHGVGVIHRDVKPGNVLITEEGDAKLCDFGLAREAESTHSVATASEHVVGTLDYLSPEQALGRDLDPRADLYAVGCVIFEMLTGSVPHKRPTSVATLVAHVQETAPRVRTLRPDVPAWLDDLVARLLEKKPSRRPPNAAEVLAELGEGGARRRMPWRVVGVAAGLAVCAVVLVAFLARRGPPVRLAFDETGAVRGVDRSGRVLWSHALEAPRSAALARLSKRAVPSVVLANRDLGEGGSLTILDAATGAERRAVRLPSGAWDFVGFEKRFVPTLGVADLDGDGVDEVVVSFAQEPYWPSYTVLWEPALDRTRVVFIASGHHRFAGAVDLDGDGKKELLLTGMANRLGWYGAVAAVRLVPAVGAFRSVEGISGHTPDRVHPSNPDATLWYALVRGYSGIGPALEEVRPNLLRLGFNPPIELDFAGFRPGSGNRPAAERQRARAAAWAALREAEHYGDGGAPERRLDALARALTAAREAGDDVQEEWVKRATARALIAAGRGAEAEPMLEDVVRSPFGDAGAHLEAAAAFHLRGELAEAVRWYRRGLALGRVDSSGMTEYADLREGELLALGELGLWGRAAEEVEAFARNPGMSVRTQGYRQWVRWRSGEPVDPASLRDIAAPNNPDFFRLVVLESRLAAGEPPDTLLGDTTRQMAAATNLSPLLGSLRAELFSRLGRSAEALAQARLALDECRAAAKRDVLVRAHLDLVAARTARIARAAGDRTLEAEAKREGARVEAERARERARLEAASR